MENNSPLSTNSSNYFNGEVSTKKSFFKNTINKIYRNINGFITLEAIFWISLIFFVFIKAFDIQRHYIKETNKKIQWFGKTWNKLDN